MARILIRLQKINTWCVMNIFKINLYTFMRNQLGNDQLKILKPRG